MLPVHFCMIGEHLLRPTLVVAQLPNATTKPDAQFGSHFSRMAVLSGCLVGRFLHRFGCQYSQCRSLCAHKPPLNRALARKRDYGRRICFGFNLPVLSNLPCDGDNGSHPPAWFRKTPRRFAAGTDHEGWRLGEHSRKPIERIWSACKSWHDAASHWVFYMGVACHALVQLIPATTV